MNYQAGDEVIWFKPTHPAKMIRAKFVKLTGRICAVVEIPDRNGVVEERTVKLEHLERPRPERRV